MLFCRLSFRVHVAALGASACLLVGATTRCLADDTPDSTLTKMHHTGRITIGVRDAAKPTLYRDGNGEPAGYYWEICKRLVDAIKLRFDLPRLKVVTVSATLATRFALLTNGTTDIDCGPNALTGSGMRQALFTHAALLTETRVMTTEENKAMALAQYDGKIIGVVAGDTSTALLRAYLRQSRVKVIEAYGRHVGEVFSMLEAGRVDAILASAPDLVSARLGSANPSRYVLLDDKLNVQPIAMMMRLTDEKLLSFVNEVLATMMRTGEMGRLYDRWFVQPLPGMSVSLDMPAPSALLDMFKNPGSEMARF